ncbi:ATP-binding protein [Thermosediminibacter oceani]|uniref:4Fe-4S ferredoxin iron-sulfur binding domain protein n=1 Tax=Thermosediminibacter oceani (strain ATCC BAA-1034 / DSM 16646 / JW/IW-1228P) TaxID=555079 RepID=D9RYR3_THEOJ|nr:4Fe-4S binding protein [Thermosediminibacter oceani]ADL08487.1 4Fe-4S ferredoxin iron-sulfur binding domain protein [Thermosediminibacter oceani DSM 16646]
MAIRKIVHIDEEKCNGCGLCVPACAEGAIQIIDGKARLISDRYCDGLGACLGECPRGAITIIEREAEEFDEEAVKEHLSRSKPETMAHAHHGFSCPGSQMMNLKHAPETGENVKAAAKTFSDGEVSISIRSQLGNWPVQLMLVPVDAPYFDGADLLVTADCVPFAYPNYHLELLKGKSVVIGCPKLDDGNYYVKKLAEIFKRNHIKSVTVAHMEVPCCYGLVKIVEEALNLSGKDIPLNLVEIGIKGDRKN